ncbi:hypothetical protein AAC387_Pa05g1716 [Persea americana]
MSKLRFWRSMTIPRMHGDIRAGDKVIWDTEATTGPFPRGPFVFTLLPSFMNHIVVAIWNGEVRLPLKWNNHGQKLHGWPQNVEGTPNNVFRDLVVRLGLSPLITASYKFISKNTASTFVERWQPKTNNFHTSFGEMAITLDDVGTILKILLTGRSLPTNTLSVERVVNLVRSQLGVSPKDAHNELSGA